MCIVMKVCNYNQIDVQAIVFRFTQPSVYYALRIE